MTAGVAETMASTLLRLVHEPETRGLCVQQRGLRLLLALQVRRRTAADAAALMTRRRSTGLAV